MIALRIISFLLLLVVVSCENSNSNNIDLQEEKKPESKQLEVSKSKLYHIDYINYLTTPKLKKYEGFIAEKIVISKIENPESPPRLWNENLCTEITDNLEVKWLFNFLTSSYNQRYCCCPNRDLKIKFEDKNGDSILFYVDTIYNKNEIIIYPPNYNFCLETKDKLLLDLLKK